MKSLVESLKINEEKYITFSQLKRIISFANIDGLRVKYMCSAIDDARESDIEELAERQLTADEFAKLVRKYKYSRFTETLPKEIENEGDEAAAWFEYCEDAPGTYDLNNNYTYYICDNYEDEVDPYGSILLIIIEC